MFMNKTSIGSAVAAALLALCASSASAQTSGNITIGGNFIPATCSVSIASGGALDWGTVSRDTVLNSYANYASALQKRFPTKTVELSVVCQSATVVGLDWVDNRASTRMAVDTYDGSRYGLTNSNIPGQVLGGFTIAYGTPTTSSGGAINAYFYQPTTGGAWAPTVPFPNYSASGWAYPNWTNAFGRSATSTTTPVPLADFKTILTVEPYVSTAIVTNSTSSIVMDGSATVTLKYF